jgi:hypothetical protein
VVPELAHDANRRTLIVTRLSSLSAADANARECDVDRDEDLVDFEAAARRPLARHLRNSFIKTYKPVLDDAPYRAFTTMAEYRAWCEEALPDWLGYGRV